MGIINYKKTDIHYMPIKFSEASQNFKNNIASLSLSLDKALADTVGVLLCGVEKGCGATSIACGLAIKESEYKKTLLVELNFRNPNIAEYFSVPSIGLSDYLDDKIGLEEAICKISDNLSVISAGNSCDTAFEILASGRFIQLYSKIIKGYDRVIFDCANLKDFSEATVLGKIIGNVALVINANSKKRDISNAFKVLDIAKINVVGLIMNKK